MEQSTLPYLRVFLYVSSMDEKGPPPNLSNGLLFLIIQATAPDHLCTVDFYSPYQPLAYFCIVPTSICSQFVIAYFFSHPNTSSMSMGGGGTTFSSPLHAGKVPGKRSHPSSLGQPFPSLCILPSTVLSLPTSRTCFSLGRVAPRLLELPTQNTECRLGM